MASASILMRLTERARLAETIIVQLKTQINSIKQTAVAGASKVEEEKLRKENEALRQQVESLRARLVLAEVKNGVKQIQMPVRNFSTSTAVAMDTKDPETASVISESSIPIQKEQKGKAKGKGEGQKALAGEEPKAKKGKKSAEVPPANENVDISRLDLRVGKIVGVKKHPDADSLYVEDVDLGEGKTRTIVSGLVKHVPIEEMQDRVAIFMCNLKAAKMRGIMSEGMIMCANGAEKIEILVAPTGSQIGEKVKAADYPGEPDVQLNPKKKIWEAIKPDLRTNADRVAAYKGAPLSVEGRGVVVAPTQADAQIS